MERGRHADADCIGMGEQFVDRIIHFRTVLLPDLLGRPGIQVIDTNGVHALQFGIDADMVLPHGPNANDADIHVYRTR